MLAGRRIVIGAQVSVATWPDPWCVDRRSLLDRNDAVVMDGACIGHEHLVAAGSIVTEAVSTSPASCCGEAGAAVAH